MAVELSGGDGASQTRGLAETIRRRIFDGTLRPGQLLSQKALAAWLGVSRIPVREALRVLDGEGLVVHEPGVGIRVRLFDQAGLRELYEVRQGLERTLATHIVTHVRDQDLHELAELVTTMDGLADVHAWSDVNWSFHSVLHRVARRPTTVRVLQHLFAQAEPYSREFLRREHHLHLAQAQHHRILALLRCGDAQALGAEMAGHIFGALDPLLPVVHDLASMPDDETTDLTLAKLVRPESKRPRRQQHEDRP